MERDFNENWEYEEEEAVVVVDADTIIDPRAMVVKSLNALIADRTMPWSGSSYDLAFRAKISRIDITKKLHKVIIIHWLQCASIFTRGKEESQEYK